MVSTASVGDRSQLRPSSAVNQLEMWHPETFDQSTIDRELGWAERLGINSMRVFLHDLPWQQDPAGFRGQIDTVLAIAARHHIRVLFVLFDSCWDPNPTAGPQRPQVLGVDHPGWVQSPGAAALANAAQRPRQRAYVEGVVGAFARDPRVLGRDIWNEPDSPSGHYPTTPNKLVLVTALIGPAFAWARSQNPIQPLTSGVFQPAAEPDAMARLLFPLRLFDTIVSRLTAPPRRRTCEGDRPLQVGQVTPRAAEPDVVDVACFSQLISTGLRDSL